MKQPLARLVVFLAFLFVLAGIVVVSYWSCTSQREPAGKNQERKGASNPLDSRDQASNTNARAQGAALASQLALPIPDPIQPIDRRNTAGGANPARDAALAKIRADIPGVQVDFDTISGAPNRVQATGRFLNGAQPKGEPAREVVEEFVDRYRDLFAHPGAVLRDARVTREDITAHNGVSTLVWQQQLDGIPLFNTILKANVTKDGQLVTLTDHFLANPEQAAGKNAEDREALIQASPVDAPKAISLAAVSLGDQVAPGDIAAQGPPEGAERKQRFAAPKLSDTTAQLTWMPLSGNELRLAWDVTVTSLARNTMFRTIVDAQTGELLYRTSLTNDITDATYRVYADATTFQPFDSPAPFSPAQQGGQPQEVARQLITIPAENTTASPNGWINDGGQETQGNNVDAHTDFDAVPNSPDLPRPNGGASRVFDFSMDLATQAPSAYANAAVVQLFYLNNWMHDKLYALGFTESAGNFQTDNFGRGGLGNDAVQADAQDSSGTNNANFSTPPDGSPGRMQMYVFTSPNPDRDGDLDAEVVLHEYSHGLSNRLVGGGVGMSALQSRGMGEGWSDFYALCLLSQTGDDADGDYPVGCYVLKNTSGIRRYPYSTNLSKNPLTFRYIDPSQGAGGSSEVHNQGEVWCVALWEVRRNLVGKHGFATGNPLMLQLATDAMKLCPVNPNFLQSRDAILQADLVLTGGANSDEIWAGFAKRGMGANATSPASSTTTGVVESYEVPDELGVTPIGGTVASGPVGGPFTPAMQTYTLTNTGAAPITWTGTVSQLWMSLSTSGGTLAPGASTTVTLAFNQAAAALSAGTYGGAVKFSNTGSASEISRSVTLISGVADYYTELFDTSANDTDNQSWLFTPNGSNSYYSVAKSFVTSFPTDPTGGTALTITGDDYTQITPSGGVQVSLYGVSYPSFYVSTKGYVTLGSGEFTWDESLANHFAKPRIAALFDDLNPVSGSVSWKQLADRIAVTWQNVPEWEYSNQNSFQIEMYFDGRIRITCLGIAATDGLIGLSRGQGTPASFVESDFSAYGAGGGGTTLTLQLSAPASASEGDGVLTGAGTVTLSAAQAADVTVSLTSLTPAEATVPASVTVPAGQASRSFDITIVDDALLDGPQNVVFSASATGIPIAAGAMTVLDNDGAGTLTLAVPASTVEGAGTLQGTLTSSVVPGAPLTVALVSSDTTEIVVPAYVVIPSGATSVDFPISVINDTLIDGSQTANLTAQISGWAAGAASVTVADNEDLDLRLTLPGTVNEGGTGTGSVSISGSLPAALVVSIASGNASRLSVPATATIAAGATSAYFTLTGVNNALQDGSSLVNVSASASGFNGSSGTVTVLDNDMHHYSLSPIGTSQVRGVPFSVTITAQDVNGLTIPTYTGSASLGAAGSAGAVAITPTTTGVFSAGVKTLSVTALAFDTSVVLTADDGGGHTGSSNAFDVGVGTLHHFSWGTVSSPQSAGVPFSATVTAQDSADNTVASFTGTANLSAYVLAPAAAKIVISEINPNTPDEIEFTNAGTGSVDVSGWQVFIYDNVSGSASPLAVFTIPAGTTCAAGAVFRLQESGSSPGAYPLFYFGSNVDWTSGVGSKTAVLLRNASGEAVDFAVANGSSAASITSPQTIPSTQWSGASIPAPANTTHGYSRIGSADANTASDWTAATPGMGTANPGLSLPLQAPGSIPVTPAVSGSFAGGVWTGNVAVAQQVAQVRLRADGGAGQTGDSNVFDVSGTVVANSQSLTVPHNTATAVTLTGQDTADPGATLTFAVATHPSHGVLSGAAPDLLYTPAVGYAGVDSFTFTAANGSAVSFPATVSLTVRTAMPEIAVEQPAGNGLTDGTATVDYGVLPIGLPQARTFTVRNTGAEDLIVSGITKDGANSGDVIIGSLSSSTIAGGASGTFDLTVNPSTLGARSAAIHILCNDADEASFDIALTATGSAGFPDIGVEQPLGTLRPDSGAIVDFGTTLLGVPVTRTFTITNGGGADLVISGVSVDGTAAAQFAAALPSQSTIPPSGSATLDVVFVSAAPGVWLAALHVASNDPDEGSYDIEMQGISTVPPGPVALVRDVNTLPNGGTIANFVASGSYTYYTYGSTIYRTNGTGAGTSVVGYTFGSTTLAFAGTTLLYSGNDSNGTELWSWNGTTAARLADIYPGGSPSSPALMKTVGSIVYFTANNGTNGTELWKSDGTSAGTVMVKDVYPGSGSSSIANLTDVNGTLYFTATDGTNGFELWKSDGTTAGTVMVSDIYAGSFSSSPAYLTAVGSTVYFAATTATNGTELWKSDGTSSGTSMVLDIVSGTSSSTPAYLFSFGGTLYFRAYTSAAGFELWKSDGTSGGTSQVKDVFPGTTSSYPWNFASAGSTLYFIATDSTANGQELWKTDGTTAGTVMVANINGTANGSSLPTALTAVGSTLYFSATDGSTGAELWKTDGTATGTAQVKDINLGAAGSGISLMTNFGGVLFFGATDGVTGSELWRSDGTVGGTYRVLDAITGNSSSNPSNMIALGSEVFYAGFDGPTGTELWKSDGSFDGTVLLKDIYSGSGSSAPANLAAAGSVLFFSAQDSTNGIELWKTDGTTAGTVLVKDIYSSSSWSSPTLLRAAGSTVFFAANDGTNGQELWKSDGTLGGTVLVKNINPTVNAGSSIVSPVVVNGTTLYFGANDGTNGTELWKSDGTSAGTVLVKNINAGSASSSPSNFTAVGSTVFFSATDGVNGSGLWKTDGTEAGTVMVKDNYPASPSNLIAYNGKVYFYASDGVNLAELWTSDGTGAGTYMVKDINPGPYNSSVSNFTVHNGLLYFSATNSFGNELWRTDGTAAGTVLVKDINPGASASSPANLVSSGAYLYFTAATAANGTELWRSDGTAAGTQMVTDLYPGTGSSSPIQLRVAGSRLFFSASIPGIGSELFSFDLGSGPEISLYEGADTTGPERLDNAGTCDFGVQASPAMRSFTVKNSGTGCLYVSDITVSGPQAGSFVVLAKPDSAVPVMPGGTATFTVTATLEGPVSQSAVFSVLSNDADEGSFEVPVTATVVDEIAPVISAPATYLIGQPGTLAMSLPDLRHIVTYTDNLPGDGNIAQTPVPNDETLAIGETRSVEFVASDAAGNPSNTVTTQVTMGLGQQEGGGLDWVRSGSGVGSEGTVTRAVAAADGGAYVAGNFTSSPFTLGSGADQVTLTSSGNADVFVARFAKDGTLLWARSAGSVNNDSLQALAILADGSAMVAGSIGLTATFGSQTITATSQEGFVARYLPDGTVSWAKGISGTGTEIVVQLVVLGDGNLAIAGSFTSTGTVTFGPGVTLSNIGVIFTDLFVAKYDAATGTALWARGAGSGTTSEITTGLTLVPLPDGGVAVAGVFFSGILSFSGSATTLTNTYAGNSDWFAAKYDAAGTLQWARAVGGGTASDPLTTARALSSGDLVLAGTFQSSTATFGAGQANQQVFTNLGGTSADVAVVRLSGADGLQQWAKRAGSNGVDAAAALLVQPDDSLALTGTFVNGSMQLGAGEPGFTTLTTPVAGNKLFLACFDGGTGALRWARSTGGMASDASSAMALLWDGDIGVSGGFGTPSSVFGPGEAGAVTLVNSGTGNDVFFAKFDRATGNLRWAKSGGGANTDVVHGMTALTSGSVMLVGSYQPSSATFGAGESNPVILPNADSSGTNTDLFFGRFFAGGVEPPAPPIVALLLAGDLSPNTLTFNASIDSRGQDTTVLIDYGATTGYGITVPAAAVPAGMSAVTRSLSLSGLAPLTTLHFRVRVTNPQGTTTSEDQVITTFADADIVVEEPAGIALTDGVSSVSFGTVPLGSSLTKTFTVRNSASAGTLSGLTLAKSGAAAADYTLGSLGATSLSPGESTTFDVTYEPSAGGVRAATLLMGSNDGDENPFEIALTGNNLVDATFNAASEVPIIVAGFTVPAGRSLGLNLGFAPSPGCVLTVVNNTAADLISGSFLDLPQGGLVAASFGGQTWIFQANYYGGDGNDLVLKESFEWIWKKGSSTSSTPATYGTQGVANASNTPAGRSFAQSWIDSSGKLWLFGGNPSTSAMNDLWKFDPSTSQWTWMKGSTGSGAFGTYGTLGVPGAANTPGGRYGGATWVDSQDRLWLFGGYGLAASGSISHLNDLWRYDPAVNMWTWLGGSSNTLANGTYGTQGIPSTANTPGSRYNSSAWLDQASGSLWLFGGWGLPASGSTIGHLNDLWKYDLSTGQWTWMTGSSSISVYGTYGTKGVPGAGNTPGSRNGCASWKDLQGRFWLFGGVGYGTNILGSYLGDLWCYDPASNLWTWMSGSGTAIPGTPYFSGVYGIQATASPGNAPGFRQYPVTWTDRLGRLWMLGGIGYGALGATTGDLNDLWYFDTVRNQWVWVKGQQSIQKNGVYGTVDAPAADNQPGAREQAAAFRSLGSTPELWLFGGLGYASTGNSQVRMNDVWMLDLPDVPTSTTAAAATITDTGATLNATGNPSGTASRVRFYLSTAADLTGATLASAQDIGSGTSAVAVSLPVTGLNPGTTYFVAAETFSDSGRALGSILSFTTLTTAEAWRLANFGTTSNAGNAADNADPDGDGIKNLMEFALGANPTTLSTDVLPTAVSEVKLADSESYFTFSYRRRIVPGALTYVLQSSTDLITWTAISGLNLEQVGAPVPTGDGVTEVITFRVLPSIDDSPTHKFVRLRVSN